MKSIIKKTKVLTAIALGLFAATLFSFSSRPGGEGFEVYVNNKLVLQQFNKDLNAVKDLQLTQSQAATQLTVKYYHCGKTGKNRSITIRDGHNKILKEWKFTDVSTAAVSSTDASMSCKVSDILSVQKNNPGKLGLYYTSSELPGGRQLATLVMSELVKSK